MEVWFWTNFAQYYITLAHPNVFCPTMPHIWLSGRHVGLLLAFLYLYLVYIPFSHTIPSLWFFKLKSVFYKNTLIKGGWHKHLFGIMNCREFLFCVKESPCSAYSQTNFLWQFTLLEYSYEKQTLLCSKCV